MPDNNGKLSPKEIEQFRSWLNQTWGSDRACPVSGHTDWELGDVMVMTTAYARSGILFGGSTYPLLVVICSGCGYTAFLNAIKVGLVSATQAGAWPPSAPPRTPDL